MRAVSAGLIAVSVSLVTLLLTTSSIRAQFIAIPKPIPMLIEIDKRDQRMVVTVEGKAKYRWWVSTGVSGLDTVSGAYKVSWLDRDHKSTQFNDAPMPYSIFFHRGQAIHGFAGRVGGRASHGCVRLNIGNAKTLYNLVAQDRGLEGWKYDATIIVR